MRKFVGFIFEVFKIVVISLLIVVPVRYFVVQPFLVKGMSMTPNFEDNEYLLVNEMVVRLGKIHRGDVIVFHYPKNPSNFFIKRVIGLPGEEVVIRDGWIKIISSKYPQGRILNESSYLGSRTYTGGELDIKLDKDEYFVLGDNRGASFDSRQWGPLDRRYVVGRVWLRVWPFQKAHAFAAPHYGL